MVLVLSIPPNEAIKRFAEARGYEIERENYISSIMLHDSNLILKKTANTLPVLIPNTQLAIKRSNQTEIDDERYDDHKKRNFNSGAFSKSNAEHSQSYYNRDRRHYEQSEKYDVRSNGSRYGSNFDSSYRSSWKSSSHMSRRNESNCRPTKPYDSRTGRLSERTTDGDKHRRSRWDKYKNQSDHR